MPFDIELDALQNSVKEFSFNKTAVRLQHYLRETPSQIIYKKN